MPQTLLLTMQIHSAQRIRFISPQGVIRISSPSTRSSVPVRTSSMVISASSTVSSETEFLGRFAVHLAQAAGAFLH